MHFINNFRCPVPQSYHAIKMFADFCLSCSLPIYLNNSYPLEAFCNMKFFFFLSFLQILPPFLSSLLPSCPAFFLPISLIFFSSSLSFFLPYLLLFFLPSFLLFLSSLVPSPFTHSLTPSQLGAII